MKISDLFKELVVGFAILPMLLGSVYASRQEFDLNVEENITVGTNLNYNLTLLNNFNFVTNSEYKVIQVKGAGGNNMYPRLSTFFWNGSGMYLLKSCEGGYFCQNIHTSIKSQGFFTNCGISTLSNIDFNILNQWPSGGGTNINNCLIDDYSNPDKLYINGVDDYQVVYLCFGYTSIDKMLCFYNNDTDNSNLTNSLGFTYNPYISELGGSDDQISQYFTFSPFTFSNIPSLPDYSLDLGEKLTNLDILKGFEYIGLQGEYCYGGFPIDNIFQPGESYEAFTGYKFGSGADIIQLYNLYSGAYSVPKNFMGSLRSAYLNKQWNRFYTEPKALFMIVHQYYSMYDRGQISFHFLDVWDYCKLIYDVQTGQKSWSDVYDGDNQNAIDGAKASKMSQDQGGFVLSGVVNTNSGGISSPDEFFGRVTNLINENLNAFDGSFDPIIPGYIIVFMLAFILVRLISH